MFLPFIQYLLYAIVTDLHPLINYSPYHLMKLELFLQLPLMLLFCYLPTQSISPTFVNTLRKLSGSIDNNHRATVYQRKYGKVELSVFVHFDHFWRNLSPWV